MKKIIAIALTCLATYATTNGQDFSKLDKSPLDMVYYPARAAFRGFAKTSEEKISQTPKIRVIYSRPAAAGRAIFGELVPFGQPWRIGANESTEIQFFTPVSINGTVLPAGRYSMIAIPTKDSWTIKFNFDVDLWGAYSYRPEMDVASITVPTASSNEQINDFSITLYEASKAVAHLKIGWDKTVVEVPITFL